MADASKKPQKKTKPKKKNQQTVENKLTKDNSQDQKIKNNEKKVPSGDGLRKPQISKNIKEKPVTSPIRTNAKSSPGLKETKTSVITEKGKSSLFPMVSRVDGSKKPIYGTNNTLELIQPIPSKVVDDKLDEVLQAVRSVDATCDFRRCKTRTNLIGQNCDFCQKRYCFSHGLPEIHGCGSAIKLEEQKKFRNPVPLKTIRHEKEVAQAKVKLESKLKEMKISRLAKPPPSKNPFTTGKTSTQKKKSK